MHQTQKVNKVILHRQIRQFIEVCYAMLDYHAPAEEFWRMLADCCMSQDLTR